MNLGRNPKINFNFSMALEVVTYCQNFGFSTGGVSINHAGCEVEKRSDK